MATHGPSRASRFDRASSAQRSTPSPARTRAGRSAPTARWSTSSSRRAPARGRPLSLGAPVDQARAAMHRSALLGAPTQLDGSRLRIGDRARRRRLRRSLRDVLVSEAGAHLGGLSAPPPCRASCSTPSEAAGARRARPHRRRRPRSAVPRRRRRAARRLHPAPAQRPAPPRRRDLVPGRARGRRRRGPARHRAARGPRGDRPAARRRRARRRAAADADHRDQLLASIRSSASSSPAASGRCRRARSTRCSSSRSPTLRAGYGRRRLLRRGCRSAPTPTWSATTSSGARPPGSSPTCSSGWTRSLEPGPRADRRQAVGR